MHEKKLTLFLRTGQTFEFITDTATAGELLIGIHRAWEGKKTPGLLTVNGPSGKVTHVNPAEIVAVDEGDLNA